MFFFCLLLTLNESRLEEIKTFVLKSLDVVFTFTPFSEFLLLHEFSPQVEASFVGGGRQGVFKCSLLPHLFDEFHFGHGSRESTAELKVLDGQYFRDVVSF